MALLSNLTLEADDLIRPLSLDAVIYFASGEIPLAEDDKHTLTGKFIRIGNLMLIGTTIRFGKSDMHGDKDFIRHFYFFEYLERHEDAFTGREVDAISKPICGGLINDAGSSRIVVHADKPAGLMLYGSSGDFGKANEVGRLRTYEVAQLLVGESVYVSNT